MAVPSVIGLMREAKAAMIETKGRLDGRTEGLLLGCLRTEITSIYGDPLQTPLPANLRALIDRLEDSLQDHDRRTGRPG